MNYDLAIHNLKDKVYRISVKLITVIPGKERRQAEREVKSLHRQIKMLEIKKRNENEKK